MDRRSMQTDKISVSTDISFERERYDSLMLMLTSTFNLFNSTVDINSSSTSNKIIILNQNLTNNLILFNKITNSSLVFFNSFSFTTTQN